MREAWKNGIHSQNQSLFFDHNYAAKVFQKKRTLRYFKKKNLKEEGILYISRRPWQRIHWEARPLTYESVQAAAKELNLRGITTETLGRSTARVGIKERLQQALPWQQTGNPDDTAT